MSELTDVLDALSEVHARGERGALATIVAVRGSTYRRPGARLLVREHAEPVGNISGGCLEGDVERIGREVLASGEPRVVRFDLTADDDAVWGYGLGCNGAIELFVQPTDQAVSTADLLRSAIERQQPCCLATVIESTDPAVTAGAGFLVPADGMPAGATGGGSDTLVTDAARRALMATGSRVEELATEGGSLRVFLEVVLPPPRLLVCGAGHDAIPLVRLAGQLGWRVVVVDPRERFLTRERFPEAAALLDPDPRDLAEVAPVDERTYAIVMTHNYLRDMEYVRALIASPAPYLGILGPRRRTEQLLRELAEQGVEPTDEQRARIRAPAGLDLGAETPDEIAASIVAEVLAVQRERAGGPLRDRRGPIHARAEPAPAGDRR